MKKFVFFSVILASFWLFVGNANISAQTRQENKQVADIEDEITRLHNQLNRLDNQFEDTTFFITNENRLNAEIGRLRSDTTNPMDIQRDWYLAKKQLKNKEDLLSKVRKDHDRATAHNREIKKNATDLVARISQLEKNRKTIFDRYTTTTGIPREMTCNTMKRRLQSNVIRREEASLDVLEHMPIYGDVVDSTLRFKVILENIMAGDATFMIKPIDGGLEQPITLAPGQKTNVFLVPGKYFVIVKNNNTGRIIGTGPLTVDRVIKSYKGEECHAFASTPRW